MHIHTVILERVISPSQQKKKNNNQFFKINPHILGVRQGVARQANFIHFGNEKIVPLVS